VELPLTSRSLYLTGHGRQQQSTAGSVVEWNFRHLQVTRNLTDRVSMILRLTVANEKRLRLAAKQSGRAEARPHKM